MKNIEKRAESKKIYDYNVFSSYFFFAYIILFQNRRERKHLKSHHSENMLMNSDKRY